MGLYKFINKHIFKDKRRKERDLDLNLPENKDIIENPELLSQILHKNRTLKTIKVTPNLSSEHKSILEEEAPNKEYTYKSDKATSYSEGYDKINRIKNRVTDFEQYKEADEIYNKIIEGMNPKWEDICKFKYLYNSLAMYISYDDSVLGDLNDELEDVYKSRNVAGNIFTSIITNRGICIGVAESYEYLCKKAGLECELEDNLEMRHAYNIITYKDNNGEERKSYCDLTWDLNFVKQGQPCKNFAKSSEDFLQTHKEIKYSDFRGIDESEQRNIDIEIEYIPKDGNYTINKYIEAVENFKDIENNEDKVNIVLQKITELGELKHMSNEEVVVFAKLLLEFADVSQANVSTMFVRNKKEDRKETRSVLSIKDIENSTESEEKYLYYVFNDKQQQFKSLDKEVLEELLASGILEMYANTKLPGFENWGSEKQIQKKIRNTGLDR